MLFLRTGDYLESHLPILILLLKKQYYLLRQQLDIFFQEPENWDWFFALAKRVRVVVVGYPSRTSKEKKSDNNMNDPYQFGIGCTINIYHHTCSKMFDMPQNNNILLERDECFAVLHPSK